MLRQLYISDYLLISELNVHFKEGFNVITGETGAGKSIVVGALQLLFGRRSNTKVIRSGSKKCIIEGTFSIKKEDLSDFFVQNDLDFDEECIIRREIRDSGNSRVFINDTPVNLSVLNELSSVLMDFHQQQDQSLLKDTGYYINIIDHLSGSTKELEAYQKLFKTHQSLQNKLNTLEKQFDEQQKNMAFNEFQLNEINDLAIQEEDENIDVALSKAENAEHIQLSLSAAQNLLEWDDFSALSQLRQARQKIAQSSKHDVELDQKLERIDAVIEELSEINSELEHYLSKLTIDEEELLMLRERSDEITRLLTKHKITGVKALIELQQHLTEQVMAVNSNREIIDDLKVEIEQSKSNLNQRANKLSASRSKGIKIFEKQIQSTLIDLGMKHNVIKVEVTKSKHLHENGLDEMEVLFSANKGIEPKPLHQIASGGERSRIMLSIKSLIAEHLSLPILIFDEIDSGISGDVAMKVGRLIRSISASYQIICISHLPQVVAQGNHHILVFKEDDNQSTFTKVKSLSEEERIVELAVMLSGHNPSEAAISNAKGLLNFSNN